MSICLAVLAESRKKIICITDKKVSFSGFSADYLSPKAEPSVGGSAVMIAGDDAQYATLIMDSARKSLGSTKNHPADVAQAIDDAYHEQVSELIERRVLSRFNFDTESFRKQGKRLCSETQYARLCERIDKIEVSLRFLICGFDDKGEGHILTAGGNEGIQSFDRMGLWAIGEGQEAALASLSFQISRQTIWPPWNDLDRTLAAALAAKFMAESANSVGEGTFLAVLDSSGLAGFMQEKALRHIRQEWLKRDAPQLSQHMIAMMAPHLSSSDELDDEP